MEHKPEPGPEQQLLRRALARSGQSAPEAAAAIGVHHQWLRAVLSGYKSTGGGTWRRARARPDTLARIALHLNITADQLRAVGREDAAALLEPVEPPPAPVDPLTPTSLSRLTRAELLAELERREGLAHQLRRWYYDMIAPRMVDRVSREAIDAAADAFVDEITQQSPEFIEWFLQQGRPAISGTEHSEEG